MYDSLHFAQDGVGAHDAWAALQRWPHSAPLQPPAIGVGGTPHVALPPTLAETAAVYRCPLTHITSTYPTVMLAQCLQMHDAK